MYHRGGVYYARITILGKQTWRSLDTKKVRAAKKLLAQLQTGRASEVKKRSEPTLHEAMRGVIEFRKSRRGVSRPLSPETIRYHGELLKIAERIFEDHKLSAFSAEQLTGAIADCGLSQSRRKSLFELAKGAYARAVADGQVSLNPLIGIVPDQVPRKERQLPSREELDQIVEEMEREFPEVGKSAALCARFLAFSGLRWSEARGVQWEHVQGSELLVEGLHGRLKTARARRRIHINGPLRAVLEDIADTYGKKGNVMPMRSIRRYLTKACENLDLPKVGHHDLRSWFCTWCLTSGIDVPTTADWMGDDPNVILRTYAQSNAKHKREAASKLR